MAEMNPIELALPAKDGKPATSITLRSCTVADAPLFEPFWRVVSKETTHTYQTPENPPDFTKVAENWAKIHASPFELRIGAFENGSFPEGSTRLVAQLGMYGVIPGHPWTKHLATFGMMCRREVWGRGVGSALLRALDDHARSVGVKKIEANVRVENERGVKFYQAAGYRIEGTRTRAALIDGRFRDEYWIAKDLG
ncbi:MAG: GNAT family N-acetyltransferase [Bdellovibrionales bacterium]|nr:GNAT family N-acetyltransferase [Bdellovibrionales bacterium]